MILVKHVLSICVINVAPISHKSTVPRQILDVKLHHAEIKSLYWLTWNKKVACLFCFHFDLKVLLIFMLLNSKRYDNLYLYKISYLFRCIELRNKILFLSNPSRYSISTIRSSFELRQQRVSRRKKNSSQRELGDYAFRVFRSGKRNETEFVLCEKLLRCQGSLLSGPKSLTSR